MRIQPKRKLEPIIVYFPHGCYNGEHDEVLTLNYVLHYFCLDGILRTYSLY